MLIKLCDINTFLEKLSERIDNISKINTSVDFKQNINKDFELNRRKIENYFIKQKYKSEDYQLID